jgi:D-tyrosyl-tRNA(Tyr) deacylase
MRPLEYVTILKECIPVYSSSVSRTMRLVIQRVSEARVLVEGRTQGSIRTGIVVLVGISRTDNEDTAQYSADKLLGLRLFSDEAGKMNLSVVDAGGSILVVSQFTLYGDCRKGRRPSFDAAAPPAEAQGIYNRFVDILRRGPVPIETGVFQADMEVHLVNQGPVTLLIDSDDRTKK